MEKTGAVHQRMQQVSEVVGALLVDVFHYLALFAIGGAIVWSAVHAFIGMARQRAVPRSRTSCCSSSTSSSAQWSASTSRPTTCRCASSSTSASPRLTRLLVGDIAAHQQARLGDRDGPGRDPAARARQPGGAIRLRALSLVGGERPPLSKPGTLKPRPRRSWLFVAGADEAAHRAAGRSGADAIILELEDFTPPELRPKARAHAAEALDEWRAAGAARRRAHQSARDLRPRRPGRGARGPAGFRHDVQGRLAGAGARRSRRGTGGAVELVPNIETAAGLLDTYAIARASKRVTRAARGERGHGRPTSVPCAAAAASELAYVRAASSSNAARRASRRSTAPTPSATSKGAAADARYARRLGYRMKSLVDPAHVAAVNRALTPNLARARRIVAAFEKARAAGQGPRTGGRRADRGAGLRRG